MACAVVVRVIYVAGFKSDPAISSSPASGGSREVGVGRGCAGVMLMLFSITLMVFGLPGLFYGDPTMVFLALLCTGVGWLLTKRW